MAPIGGSNQDKGPMEIVNDLWALTRDYAKQETIDPLKSLGRFFGYGLAGSLLSALGLVFGAVAILRLLQTQTGEHLSGSWNFVPYVVALVFTVVCAGLAAYAIKKPVRNQEENR